MTFDPFCALPQHMQKQLGAWWLGFWCLGILVLGILLAPLPAERSGASSAATYHQTKEGRKTMPRGQYPRTKSANLAAAYGYEGISDFLDREPPGINPTNHGDETMQSELPLEQEQTEMGKSEPLKVVSEQSAPAPAEPTSPPPAPAPSVLLNPTVTTADMFDLDNLRLGQDFAETAGLRPLLTTVPVRRVDGQEFIRVRPGEEHRMVAGILNLKSEGELFIVTKAMIPELIGEFVYAQLNTAINRQGVVFILLVRLPDPDGKDHEAWRTMRIAIDMGYTTWVRPRWFKPLGAYQITPASDKMSEPKWPDISFQELVRIGFRDKIINDLNHPAVKKLRGLV
jgi:hypothetical protein